MSHMATNQGTSMSDPRRKEPFRESSLDSDEYRERLLRKISCLVAVLEAAGAKVKRALAGPDPDVERLMRIRTNLLSTLEVCLRAKAALEGREALPAELRDNLGSILGEGSIGADLDRFTMPKGAQIEMMSLEEEERFSYMGPIRQGEIESCDLEGLTRRLQD
jgi:hypothetical protein